VERTLGWLSKCRAILVRYEKKTAIASSIGLTSKAPHLMLRLPRPGDLGYRAMGFPDA
jgi:hypothetical protein